MEHEKYYPGEPVNTHIQLLIYIILGTIVLLPPKKGKGKLPLFCGYGGQVIPVYALDMISTSGL